MGNYSDRKHQCQMCPRKFASAHQLKNHVAKVHIIGLAQLQLCPDCGTTYTIKGRKTPKSCPSCSQLQQQDTMPSLEFLEIPMTINDRLMDLDCDLCGQKFASEEQFLFHQNKDHGLFELTDDIIVQTDNVVVQDDVIDMVRLRDGDLQIPADDLVCSETFDETPVDTTLVVNTFECQTCQRSFSSEQELKDH